MIRMLFAVYVLLVFVWTFPLSEAEDETASNQVVLVCFTATWCPNCPNMKVLWDKKKSAGMEVLVVDIDKSPSLQSKWGVNRTVPTTFVVVVKDGKLNAHTKVVGTTTESKLDRLIMEAKIVR